MCERHGILHSADAAWEANGGGKFTFKVDKKGGTHITFLCMLVRQC